jgi:hypothetical protein
LSAYALAMEEHAPLFLVAPPGLIRHLFAEAGTSLIAIPWGSCRVP